MNHIKGILHKDSSFTPSLHSSVIPDDISDANAIDESPFEKWRKKLETFNSLKDGWNGYTAAAPKPVAIENALSFLQAMELTGLEPTRVAASAMGWVAITRRIGERKGFVEFYNDGSVYSMLSDRAEHMEVSPLEVGKQPFMAFINLMREYLDG